MSKSSVPPPARSANSNRSRDAACACIDPSAFYLFPLDVAIELFPIDAANHPQARRLAILLGEAQASGQPTAVLRTFCEWSRVLLSDMPSNGGGRAALVGAIGAAEAVALRSDSPLPEPLNEILSDLTQLPAPSLPAERAAVALAQWTLTDAAGEVPDGVAAWHAATDILCAVAEQAAAACDPTLGRCAIIAHSNLFWSGEAAR